MAKAINADFRLDSSTAGSTGPAGSTLKSFRA